MSFEIITTTHFDRELKHIAKKQRSIKSDLLRLIETLVENPTQGTAIGNDCYKIRMAITSKGQGKSAGARIVTHVYVEGELVYLLSIYDKVEKPAFPTRKLRNCLSRSSNRCEANVKRQGSIEPINTPLITPLAPYLYI